MNPETELLPYKPGDIQGERNQLQYLLTGPLLHLPRKLQDSNDKLDLVNHERVFEAITANVYSKLDFVASTIIASSADKRAAFATSNRLDLGEITLGEAHSYQVERVDLETATQYTVRRTDIGSDKGGFKFVKRADGTVLFRLTDSHSEATDEICDTDEPDYLESLSQASRFIDVFAQHQSIHLSKQKKLKADYIDEAFTEKMRQQHQHETKFLHKAKARFLKVGNAITNQAAKLVTAPEKPDENGIFDPNKRSVSFARIALLAAVIPFPHYSERFIVSVPIDRPFSVELARDAGHVLFFADSDRRHEQQAKLQAYDDKQIDLPASTVIATDGLPHSISIEPNINSKNMPTLSGHADSAYKQVSLGGTSPRKLVTEGLMVQGECFAANISTNGSGDISFAAANQSSSHDLTVEVSHDSLRLCNDSNNAITIDGREFYFDVRN
jgi:hypothetical protein